MQSYMLNKQNSIHLLAATGRQLVGLFSQTFKENKERQINAPNFVFFYVDDHGGLNGDAKAKNNLGRVDTLITTRRPTTIYGDGDRMF